MDDHRLCDCGHLDKDHKDTGTFTGWGQGACQAGICECKKFDCKTCFESRTQEHEPKLIFYVKDGYLEKIATVNETLTKKLLRSNGYKIAPDDTGPLHWSQETIDKILEIWTRPIHE